MHVNELDIVLADGNVVKIGPGLEALPKQRELVESLTELNSLQIAEQFPPGLLKRWPGYALARAARGTRQSGAHPRRQRRHAGGDLSAELKIVPLPEERGVGLLFFASVAEAMQAANDAAGFEAGGDRAH